MNLFKELVLGQKEKKRSVRFILKLSEDWGLTGRSIKRRIEGSRDWLGLHKTGEKGKEYKRNKGGKPFYGKVCSSERKSAGIIVFQARRGGKESSLFMEMGSCGGNFA